MTNRSNKKVGIERAIMGGSKSGGYSEISIGGDNKKIS